MTKPLSPGQRKPRTKKPLPGTEAEQALRWLATHQGNNTVGKALQRAFPPYIFVEPSAGFRIYHYSDESRLMTFADPRQQQVWNPDKGAAPEPRALPKAKRKPRPRRI